MSKLALLLGTYAADIAGELQQPGKLRRMCPTACAPVSRSTCCGAGPTSGPPSASLRRRPRASGWRPRTCSRRSRVTAGFGAQGGHQVGRRAVPIHGPIWSFGPGAYWPLLDFGRLDALINIQEMRTHEQFVNYKKTIVVAVEEVDQAIKQYRLDLAQQKALAVALTASHRAVDLAMERYERGVTDFLNVLDAQRQDYVLEDQNAVAEEVVVQQYVAFYKALGGGWELYDELPPIPEPQPAIIATARRLVNDWH